MIMKDYIPLSYINTLVFCQRRFYYEFVEGEMVVNEHVEEGKLKHARPDEMMQERSEKGKLVSRRQYVASERLGVSGYIDILEESSGMVYPVEYKKGRSGEWLNDKIQLCLQGMLIEEATGRTVPYGYLYYIASNRRKKILFDEELRAKSIETVREAFRIAASGMIPDPVHDNRCNGCSLRPICLPDEVGYLKGLDDAPKAIKPSLGIDDVLYVDEQGVSMKKQGERILVVKGDEVLRDMPVISVGQVVVCGNVALTTPLLRFLLERQIPVVFLSAYGRYEGTLWPGISRNSLLRIAQHQTLADQVKVLEIARWIVVGKLTNMRTLLMRRNREHSDDEIDRGTIRLKQMIDQATQATSLDTLLGIEGNGSAAYFSVFGRGLKEGIGFDFERRSRRPPADPVNALLSFAYSLLVSDMTSALHIIGLDPYIGFYHQPKYGRPCLALDLMEEFRPVVADSVVVSLINTGSISPEDFYEANGGWFLKDAARKKFYAAYERRKDEQITHPIFKYKLNYRRTFELQGRILAKYLMGEIDTYYPLTVR
jgi:CRISPR-associated protein Cas1